MTARSPRADGARRLLLVSTVDPSAPSGGRAMLSLTNEALLRDLYGKGLFVHRLPRSAPTLRGAIRGHVDGIDRRAIDKVLRQIADEQIDTLFLDGSNLGIIAKAIKTAAPGVRVVSFFHNVEARFFWGSFKARRTPRALAVLIANMIAERAAVRASDVRIALSARDSDGLRQLYGRGADVVAPIELADTLPRGDLSPGRAPERFALFVGGGFYANIEGIRWYAQHVAPRAALHSVVVGRGMESLAAEFADNPAITLIGGVDDLARWYRDAYVVIAPIFDGSGMKTKVAEALMHGKRVIGTPEAFSGYDPEVVKAGWCCTDADAFVAAVSTATAADLPLFEPAMRALYARFHSPEAGRNRLAGALSVGLATRRS